MQLRDTASIKTLISLCMLNSIIVYSCTNFTVYEKLGQFHQVTSNNSGQRTSVTHCYSDFQMAWNRTIVINSKMMPFKELSLGVPIFSRKQSETGHQWAE